MAAEASTSAEARTLLTAESAGVLSTLSVDVKGYPFGSVVPYCLDRQGRPVILISRIAQHHKNILVDPRVSLIVLERGGGDVQVNGRLTCLADAARVPAAEVEEVAERYYRFFPQSTGYHKVHDFEFFRLEPVRFRYIGGFGRIHWIEPAKLVMPNPFNAEEERGMVAHMNADHVEALRHYCHLGNVPLGEAGQPRLAGVDNEGFHLLVGGRIIRFQFDQPVANLQEARRELVALARRARAS
ncbi:MAG: HugZ family pyridoxamine 5'-phosphate oxidase [Chromatiales bacterium]